ncbi:hypothetical protein ACIQZB_31915 [Streptomyces sp. NPDC097727]|uniref:hypothetical protein n=1 Tax=Streptomyces sp. NPDC097727 TaxID=3366092 RepID=UPI00380B0A40
MPTRLPDGTPGTMQRWVLDTPVWEKLLIGHDFDLLDHDTVRDPGPDGSAPMTITLIRARQRRDTAADSMQRAWFSAGATERLRSWRAP